AACCASPTTSSGTSSSVSERSRNPPRSSLSQRPRLKAPAKSQRRKPMLKRATEQRRTRKRSLLPATSRRRSQLRRRREGPSILNVMGGRADAQQDHPHRSFGRRSPASLHAIGNGRRQFPD